MSHPAAKDAAPRGCACLMLLTLFLASPALAGDPLGVAQALDGIKSNWPKAAFSVDAVGLIDNAAVTGGTLHFQYVAAGAGYLTYLRVSSHGDMATVQVSLPVPASGSLSRVIQPPLGEEGAVFLFSQRPLSGLGPTTDLGSDRPHALALVRRIGQLQSQGVRLAVRRLDYLVQAPAGETQYTTRSIIRTIDSVAASGVPQTLPTRIEFDFDSDHLTVASQHNLDVFGAALITHRDRTVVLEGHTDSIGTKQYNLDLSIRRAAAARRYLIESFDLPSAQLIVTGKGESGAIAPNDTAEGRSKNRRVDFIFRK